MDLCQKCLKHLRIMFLENENSNLIKLLKKLDFKENKNYCLSLLFYCLNCFFLQILILFYKITKN